MLASASASRISELGFSGSAVKFTARYLARGEPGKAAEVIQTTAVTIGAVLACVLALGYGVLVWLVGKLIPAASVAAALAILPHALAAVWIGSKVARELIYGAMRFRNAHAVEAMPPDTAGGGPKG